MMIGKFVLELCIRGMRRWRRSPAADSKSGEDLPGWPVGCAMDLPPSSPEVPKGSFGRYEILLSDHYDKIRVESLMGFAKVEGYCQNCYGAPHWCWNKRFKVFKKIIISNEQE